MIKSVKYGSKGTDIVSISLVDSDRVKTLKSDVIGDNTLIYAIERSIAEDFSSYYSKYDNGLGITYYDIDCVDFMSTENHIVFGSDKLTKSSDFSMAMCIRYINNDSIRVVYSQDEETDKIIVRDLTKYSDALSDTDWWRLVEVFNTIVREDGIFFDQKHGIIKLNFEADEVWTKEALRVVYMLLTETLYARSEFKKYVLISNIPYFKTEENYNSLYKALLSISKVEQVICAHN